jgi:iron complex outermembrane receptor protein
MPPSVRRHWLYGTLLPLIPFSSLAMAETGNTSLDEIKVIASPVIDANKVDPFASLTTVVGRDQIEDLNATDLTAALRRTPGVTVSRFNPIGAFGGAEGGAVYIRGMGASRPGSEIKTYVDGVPFYMGVWGHPLVDLLPINAMQSINIYKGPQPQKFGNSFAAIELIPRQAQEENTQHGELKLTAGSFNTFTEQATLYGNSNGVDYLVSQGYARSDGHRKNSDGELSNGLVRLGYRFNEHWYASLLVMHADNEVSDPGQHGKPSTSNGQFNTRGTLASVSVQHTYDNIQGSFKLYHNTGRGSALNQTGTDGDTISNFTLQGIKWEESLQPWRNGNLQLGLDYDEIKGNVLFRRVAPAPTAEYDAPTLRLTSPHVALSQAIELSKDWLLTPSAGLRTYHHNVFSSETAPHAGVLLSTDKVEFRANASRGVSYPGTEVFVMSNLIPALGDSWQSLSPERLDHKEVGMKMTPAVGTTIDLAVFRDKLKDRYLFAFPPAVSQPAYINLGDYDVNGGEISWQQRWNDQFSTFLGFTVLSPSLKNLPYAPKQSLSIGTVYTSSLWRFSMDAQVQRDMHVLAQDRSLDATNTETVSGFGIVNLKLARSVPQLGRTGEVFAAIENLLDKNYAYRPGYPMPGIFVQLGISMGF